MVLQWKLLRQPEATGKIQTAMLRAFIEGIGFTALFGITKLKIKTTRVACSFDLFKLTN